MGGLEIATSYIIYNAMSNITSSVFYVDIEEKLRYEIIKCSKAKYAE